MEMQIKYLADIDKIEKIAIGDWIDLRCAEDIHLNKGEYKAIPLGIAIKLPKGYEALIAPRSSTFKNFKIISVNAVGVIDNTYLGEWHMPVYALEDTDIKKNDRICQFRILANQPNYDIVEVQEFNVNTLRGEKGFGSTGIQ